MLDSVKELLLKELDTKTLVDLFLKEVEIKDIKKLLLQEINIKEVKVLLLKEISLDEIKELLLTEIDIKKLLLKEMDVKELLSLHQGEKPKHLLAGDDQVEKASKVVNAPKKEPESCLPAYDFGLIETLKSHQKEVLSLYDLSLEKARERKYDAFSDIFGIFTTECTNHFKKVDDEIYGYLKSFIRLKNQVEKKVFSQFASEMKNNSLTISSIINQSPNIPVRDATVDNFIVEFTHLGEILKDRIQRDVNIIYPLYENSRKVVNIS